MGAVNDQVLRRIVLERVITVIESDGEESVRVVDVARHVGTAVATVFHLFGSRDELVETAQVERYVRDLGAAIEELDVATALASGHEDFRGLMIKFVRTSLSASASNARRARLAVVGSAIGNPRLEDLVGTAHQSLSLGLSVPLQRATDQRWIDVSVDPVTTAQWLLGLLFSRAFVEVGQQRFDRRAADDLTLRTVLRTLFND